MNDRQKLITDRTVAGTSSEALVPTPVLTARTIDLEATSAYRSKELERGESGSPEIPGYKLVHELGRGAFGVVYFGHAIDRPETPLAIKAIGDQGNLDRLLVEPALLSRIKHPNVVGLENYFVHDGKLILVMEFISGGDVKTLLDRGVPFTPEQVHDFLVQIGSALAEAHSERIVHRDLKPSNVLVESSAVRARYVLADFGIGRTTAGVQAKKDVGGTFLYMAPEQFRGRPGPQSDLWAVGVIGYQMLTGRLPFPGPSLQEVARQIQYTDPPPPSAVTGQALPGQLEETVLGLLRKSLSERTATATELLAQLGVREKGEPKRSATSKSLPIAEKLRRSGRRAGIVLVTTLVAYTLFNGVLSGLLVLFGLWLFYRAQGHVRRRGRRALLTAAAFIVLASPLLISLLPEMTNAPNAKVDAQVIAGPAEHLGVGREVILATLVVVLLGLTLLLPVIGSAAYANMRRARREQALLNAALAGPSGSDEYLNLMRDMLATRFEDVGFHLRYAELLYARGDHRATAVEARLITVQDPYHFDANLLLANAYFALGLTRDCRRVCDDYLAVTGYSFEFQELREQCPDGREAL